MTATWRASQKASRRTALIQAAARLFAERGFTSVSTGEIGEAVGMSGPALYKHFASKDALLSEILVDVSQRLRDGGRQILAADAAAESAGGSVAQETLRGLIRFHLDFATSDPDVIRLQFRELASLSPEDNHRVRRLQREYVQIWDGVLAGVRPELDASERRIRLMATFGLLNSTPHSAADTGLPASWPGGDASGRVASAENRTGTADAPHQPGAATPGVVDVLTGMAWRSLTG